MSDNGKIVEITDQNFAETIEAGSGLTMVDFWAEWCGPCRMVAPIVEELAEEYSEGGLKVGKLDVDANPKVTHQVCRALHSQHSVFQGWRARGHGRRSGAAAHAGGQGPRAYVGSTRLRGESDGVEELGEQLGGEDPRAALCFGGEVFGGEAFGG